MSRPEHYDPQIPGYDPTDPTAGYESSASTSALSAEDASSVAKAMEEEDDADGSGYDPASPSKSPTFASQAGRFQLALI